MGTREIWVTGGPLYSATAASIIVGVGQYLPSSHCVGSMSTSLVKRKTSAITWPSNSTLHFMGISSLSFCDVVATTVVALFALVAMSTGTIKCSWLDSWK